MASLASVHHHGWQTQAAWTNIERRILLQKDIRIFENSFFIKRYLAQEHHDNILYSLLFFAEFSKTPTCYLSIHGETKYLSNYQMKFKLSQNEYLFENSSKSRSLIQIIYGRGVRYFSWPEVHNLIFCNMKLAFRMLQF